MFDSAGQFTVLLVDPADADHARQGLLQERFIEARMTGPAGPRFDVQQARIRPARYAYDQLSDWLDLIYPAMRDAAFQPTVSGVSVRRNKILVGVRQEHDVEWVQAAVRQLDIPTDAVAIELIPPLRLLSSVHDRVRPVPGGMQIQFAGSGMCTMGPNMIRHPVGGDPPFPPEPGYLIASHCSEYPFVSYYEDPDPTTLYFQHEMLIPWSSYHIGNKGVDPPLFACMEDINGCRNSDAAQGLYPSGVSGEFGFIARPEKRNEDHYAFHPLQPRFEIVSVFSYSITGEIIDKVGRTTGWSGGEVIEDCLTWDADGFSIRCTMIVGARAGSADSGSPAFAVLSGINVELRGLLLGGTDGCVTGLDPIYQNSQWYCNSFVASNLGGVYMDLDPWLDAPLTFY